MKAIPWSGIKKIIVIRTDHIGDLILSTPFLKALRAGAPQAEIIMVLPAYTASVLENVSFIDRIISYEGKPNSALEEELRSLKADLTVCLAPRTCAYKLAYATKAPLRVGYFYPSRPLTAIMCTALYLTHSMSINLNKELSLSHPIPHEVQQLGELAKNMGLTYEDDSLSLQLSANEVALSQQMNEKWKRPTVLLQLHNNWLSCGWTVNNLARLAGGLIMTSRGGDLIICYGSAERELADNLQTALKNFAPQPKMTSEDVHFIGNLSFRRWATLFNSIDFVVTPDTGAVHLAAALKKPVVAVYEPQTASLNTQQWAPWQVAHRSIVKQEPTSSLEKIFHALDELMTDSLAWNLSEAVVPTDAEQINSDSF
ncbi:MAG: glycosyltransferase family 9 protein [Candidatus Bruticola sp.]